MMVSAGCGVWRKLARVFCLLALPFVAGCATQPSNMALEFSALPGWANDDHTEALTAFRRSCDWMKKQPPDRALSAAGAGRVRDWMPTCTAAHQTPVDRVAARQFFETYFVPVSMLNDGSEGLFTGYYESELNGSWTRTARYKVPLYRMPAGGKSMPTREQINNGALAGKGLELLWVDDATDAFFLEIQGSGRVHMTDGSMVAVHYAGQNGYRYFPIGRYLVDQGYATAEQMSMPLIRSWLKANPSQATRVMNMNPSHVFFRTSTTDVGARGALNTRLTPGRSLAVDPSYVPLGVPLWLEARNVPAVPNGILRRLVVAQDTGGAIKGKVRGDLFWGPGVEAADAAGVMKARGRYTMLVPRQTLLASAP